MSGDDRAAELEEFLRSGKHEIISALVVQSKVNLEFLKALSKLAHGEGLTSEEILQLADHVENALVAVANMSPVLKGARK